MPEKLETEGSFLDLNLQLKASVLSHGRVKSADGNSCVVAQANGMVVKALRGAGCLLEPESGDLVLLYLGAPEACFILEVLQKNSDVSVISAPGAIHLGGTDSDLSLRARRMQFTALEGSVDFLRLDVLAGIIRCGAQKISVACGSLRTRLGDVVSRMRSCFRRVEKCDTLDAEQARVFARERYTLDAGSARLKAEKDMAVDGETVHLG